jgi:predicted metal-binding transcription factor (methanogenesis marker protein 9)
MKKFHIDEPREIGKKKVRVSPKELMMLKKDLTERVVKKKLREFIKKQMEK